jgi:hypothetical protein
MIPTHWKCADGEKIKISEMEYSHLINAIKFLERNGKEIHWGSVKTGNSHVECAKDKYHALKNELKRREHLDNNKEAIFNWESPYRSLQLFGESEIWLSINPLLHWTLNGEFKGADFNLLNVSIEKETEWGSVKVNSWFELGKLLSLFSDPESNTSIPDRSSKATLFLGKFEINTFGKRPREISIFSPNENGAMRLKFPLLHQENHCEKIKEYLVQQLEQNATEAA